MSSKLRDISNSALGRFGIPGLAEGHVLTAASGVLQQYWADKTNGSSDSHHTDIENGLALMTSGRNDFMLVSPESHNQTDNVVWSKNMTHLIGMAPPSLMNMRPRLTASTAAVTSLFTVSGYGNLIANMYFPYGGDSAAMLNIATFSGERNSVMNCHFLPIHATPLDQAGFIGVDVACNEMTFKNCTFGGDSVAWTNGALVRLYGAADRSCRVVFENCDFIVNADNAQVVFLSTVAGMGEGAVRFKNCNFINTGTTMTLGINGAGLGNALLHFDFGCSFYGCTDVVAAAYESYVICGLNYAANAATSNLLAGTYDHTA